MIKVLKCNQLNKIVKNHKKQDITVFKTKKIEEYQEDGTMLTKIEKKPINISRMINETSKVLKTETAQEKLQKIAQAING